MLVDFFVSYYIEKCLLKKILLKKTKDSAERNTEKISDNRQKLAAMITTTVIDKLKQEEEAEIKALKEEQHTRPDAIGKPVKWTEIPGPQGGKSKKKSLDECTVVELKEKAKKRNINESGLKKTEIIAKLRRK